MDFPFQQPLPDFSSPYCGKLIIPKGTLCEPFGETAFLDLITLFAEQGLKQKAAGAKYLFCDNFSSLAGIRAAMFSSWQVKLPVFFSIAVDEQEKLRSGGDPLCALLVAQVLGAAGVRLYTQVDEDDLANLRDGLNSDDTFVLCSEHNVFYLNEGFELSDPLTCSLDMTDTLRDAEDAGCDVISIHLTCPEDAHCFVQSAHMAKLPVSFFAETEEALEAGLILYNGRAMIDSRSEVTDEQMASLAAGYGAVVR